MQVKTYETKVGSVRKYQFNFGRFGEIVLDDEGNEHRARLATDAEIDEKLGSFDRGFGSPSEEISALARADQRANPTLSYRQCIDRVMEEKPNLARLYASETNGTLRVYSNRPGQRDDVSMQIDRKAKLHLDSGVCKSYSEAVQKVLRESPDLTARYGAYASAGAARVA